MYEVLRHINSLKKGNTGGNGRSTSNAINSVIVTALVFTPLTGRFVRFPVMDCDNPTILNNNGLLRQCLIPISQALFILIISTIERATAAIVICLTEQYAKNTLKSTEHTLI